MPKDGTEDATEMTSADLVARAAALGPQLKERRLKAAEMRRIPDETIQDLVDSGVMKASQPKRYGGYELPFGSHTDVAFELARHCGSTAWVAGIVASHNWWLGKCPDVMQEMVWGDNPDHIVPAAFASHSVTVEPKSGGYVVSGVWLWCSGSDAGDFAMFQVPIPQPDGPPVPHVMLLKPNEYQLLDNWNSPGLRATGSQDVKVDGVFVPEDRLASVPDLNSRESVGQKVNTSATYRLPTMGVFGYSVAAPVLGMAQGALDGFIDGMKARAAHWTGQKIAEMAPMQVRIAHASGEIDAAKALYTQDIAMVRQAANDDRDLSLEELYRIKRNCAMIGQLAKSATLKLAEAMGAGGMRDDNIVHMQHNNVLAGASHITMAWEPNAIPYGKHLLGLVEETGPYRNAPKTKA